MSTFVRRNLIFIWLMAISMFLCVIAWGQAAVGRAVPSFDEIDVQRINVREPDGTLRMTISSMAKAPGLMFKGKEHPYPSRQAAGVLFFNDEGTESDHGSECEKDPQGRGDSFAAFEAEPDGEDVSCDCGDGGSDGEG